MDIWHLRPAFTKNVQYFPLQMYSSYLIDQVSDFCGSYMVDTYHF